MSRIIKTIIEIDEDDLREYIEENGGSYDENCLSEDINGALDNLPFNAFVIGYIIGDKGDD